ncbi:unknown protein [Simkania negevensis Z]|uniref:Uncharacterized protein n=1 Tax=Simkania negevensis (strain ATCC VR-1471 / DSM 27360 / Z) TaxID=331113 RepID=F8L4W4_SIMNZ|nr:unknown protein [Simkania negevensis Z]
MPFPLLKPSLVSWTMWSILGEKNSAKIWVKLAREFFVMKH